METVCTHSPDSSCAHHNQHLNHTADPKHPVPVGFQIKTTNAVSSWGGISLF